ncbi:MAG: hypothetical protein V4529_16605 [Gemmatimonadota bacterium]
MNVYSELRIRESEDKEDRLMTTRATSAECWRLIDKYEGTAHWPPKGCCYVVKVTKRLVRRPWKKPV